ncbi:glycerophosphodiester phosphodiesterase family protein [Sedimentitalea todarodis]|uniref:Glycerophosphodiester phosphodiesterase family protein n=1 Tax=Sedimentitalea todarodis TaxID=1631240 RepID=A0ABU3VBB6_9RHOB|nr:glycerophosphodiester phosphodiesterase family protein [Sedimentitalea todarodis]MDU9003059.1 glycerophosphodiester phosphodiesterase family protein [Sedimentitalea todarodis]
MTPRLPTAFLTAAIAHRALHDISQRRPENSRAAIRAAVAAGYGIEIDLQLTADAQALVFHDYDLTRLTDKTGPVRQLTAAETRQISLKHGDGETIPTLPEVVDIVAGQVPLLIEIKDQDGGMGPDIGPLERATAAALRGYRGPVAVMSFNPHSVDRMAELVPELPRGLVTCGFDPAEWPLPVTTCERLREVPDFDAAKASFISHDKDDLASPRVAELREAGAPVLCWTIRSPIDEAEARRFADNVTFEGYLPPLPG